ncbi:hypothetical protein R20233_03914 [Ralstonia sp. LMG 32965]|nr:hypothetical protein R20233_03914 [Ralstonia sp. LMG 32965]
MVNVPAPDCTRLPAPLMLPAYVTASLRLKASVPLLTMLPATEPVVPPLPICSVPVVMVVAPV